MNKEEKEKLFKEYKPLYCLETFISGEKACKEVLNRVGNDNFLLDSGAFTYMSGKECTKETIEEYLSKYIKFIKDNDVKYFFELDVDTIFGIDFVEQLRYRLETETRKKCIPVWHKSRGIDYWKKMCDNYKYVAIGGLVFHVRKEEYPLIKRMVTYARQRGVKVHGLGFTKTKELENYDWFSIDSTSWLKSACLGQQLQIFNGRCIDTKKLNKGNKKVSLSKLAYFNMKEWIKYANYMDAR